MKRTRQELTYAADFRTGAKGQRSQQTQTEPDNPVSRIARLMALASRFERLVQDESIDSYAELARLGHVTRARMTQIMNLLNLAPDIQEQILFLSPATGLNERNLRPVVHCIDWNEQRILFRKIGARNAASF